MFFHSFSDNIARGPYQGGVWRAGLRVRHAMVIPIAYADSTGYANESAKMKRRFYIVSKYYNTISKMININNTSDIPQLGTGLFLCPLVTLLLLNNWKISTKFAQKL